MPNSIRTNNKIQEENKNQDSWTRKSAIPIIGFLFCVLFFSMPQFKSVIVTTATSAFKYLHDLQSDHVGTHDSVFERAKINIRWWIDANLERPKSLTNLEFAFEGAAGTDPFDKKPRFSVLVRYSCLNAADQWVSRTQRFLVTNTGEVSESVLVYGTLRPAQN